MKTLEMIVPCFNEETAIKPFYEQISGVFASIEDVDCGLIFVDDGSRDKTLETIKSLAENDEKVKFISFSRNFGKEGAMLAGLKYSTADFVGIIDVDLQHNPNLIPEMLKAVTEEDFDVAAAKRSDRGGEGVAKRALSSLFYKISNCFTEVKIDEGAQDFRVMKRKVVDAVLALTEKERFTKGIFSFVGFKTKWFEHKNEKRVSGKSKWSIGKLFHYAMNGMVSFSSKPLRIPLVAGIIISLFAIVYGILLYIEPSWVRVTVVRLMTSVVLLMGGLTIGSIGIVGEYIAKIFKEVKGRPPYIISETNITNDRS